VEKVTVVIIQQAPDVLVTVFVRVVVSVVQQIPEVVRTVEVTRRVFVIVTVTDVLFAALLVPRLGFREDAEADIEIALMMTIEQTSASGSTGFPWYPIFPSSSTRKLPFLLRPWLHR
jgi:hypothetical protein